MWLSICFLLGHLCPREAQTIFWIPNQGHSTTNGCHEAQMPLPETSK